MYEISGFYNYDTGSYDPVNLGQLSTETALPYIPAGSARSMFVIYVSDFQVPILKAYLAVLSKCVGENKKAREILKPYGVE